MSKNTEEKDKYQAEADRMFEERFGVRPDGKYTPIEQIARAIKDLANAIRETGITRKG